jgi:hypothetical protein
MAASIASADCPRTSKSGKEEGRFIIHHAASQATSAMIRRSSNARKTQRVEGGTELAAAREAISGELRQAAMDDLIKRHFARNGRRPVTIS